MIVVLTVFAEGEPQSPGMSDLKISMSQTNIQTATRSDVYLYGLYLSAAAAADRYRP